MHSLTRTLGSALFTGLLLWTSACGGSSASSTGGGTNAAATPTISAAAALNGAQVITLADTTSGAAIYYTLDASTPTAKSIQYFAPFLLASNATLKAIATVTGGSASAAASQTFTPNIPSGTLVWSDEFSNSTGANAAPNPANWSYDAGGNGWGNDELETYCAWGSSAAPCDSSNPNAYVGIDGYLHIVARQPQPGVYTSARMKSQGLFSFSYGRVEARMKLPEGQGMWPAFWMLGNNGASAGWPACGEQDIMEHINAPQPDWVAGSLHGTNANLTERYPVASGTAFSAGDWHTYGMIWEPESIKFYVDLPSNVYATYTPSNLAGQSGAVWPFDAQNGGFILLNLAVGGSWPGSPDVSTTFPSEVLVDYVRVSTN